MLYRWTLTKPKTDRRTNRQTRKTCNAGYVCCVVTLPCEMLRRWFLTGPNPVMLRRCTEIPTDRFPVTDDMLVGLLDRTKRLTDEARVIMLIFVNSMY